MKDYNWRQEREKFRTKFKEQEPASGKSFSESAENKAGSSVTQIILKPASSSGKVLFCLVSVVLVLVVAAGWIYISKNQNSSDQFVKVAEQKKHALGFVVLTIELNNGKKLKNGIGTAWAFSENKFATNAHVALGLKNTLKTIIDDDVASELNRRAIKAKYKSVDEYLKSLGQEKAGAEKASARKYILDMINDVWAEIIINGTREKSYKVSHIQIHKAYGTVGTKFNPDIAVLTIRGKHDCYFTIADKKTLHDMKSGIPIAFLGYPSEGLHYNNVNIDNPIASMQSGIIVAVSDFDMKDAGENGNFLLRHNLPSTGGASGSPIFNRKGEVLALLYAGNIIGQVRNNRVQRAPSAALINFGVRVDLISGMGTPIESEIFLER